MRIELVTILLTLTALAGCLGGDDADTDGHDDPHDDHDDGHGQNETVEANASLVANVTSGQAPLTVLFTVSGSGFDANFTLWTLDVTGDGEADATGEDLPAEFEFTYEEVGNFTVVLEVSDGTNQVSSNLTVTVEAPPQPDAPAGPLQEESGGWTVAAQNCPHVLAAGNYEPIDPEVLAEGDGVFWGYFAVDPATIGQNWALTWESETSLVVELSFYAQDGSYISYTTDGTGAVPDNAGHGLVFPCGAGPGSYTYTVE